MKFLSLEEIQVAHQRSESISFRSPATFDDDLPLRQVFYPLGFAVEVRTNAPEILSAVAQSWSSFPQRFIADPMTLRVMVQSGGSVKCPPTPHCRIHDDIILSVADTANFSVTNVQQGIATLWIAEATLAHLTYLRYSFLDAAILCLISTRCTAPIHAACVSFAGKGILLCGDSGAGKSTLAYACSQSGWDYITDDASYLILDNPDRIVTGNSRQVRLRPAAVEFFPSLEGLSVSRSFIEGKPTLELLDSTSQLGTHTASVHSIVFLNRRGSEKPSLFPFSKEVARSYIEQTLYAPPNLRVRQQQAIEYLLEVPILELCYRDLSSAVACLRSLV